ncbi:MAG: TadE/TadG family type IV pilus assembly protein [Pseudomonadota bacterium]
MSGRMMSPARPKFGWRRAINRFLRDKAGISAVEFSLLAPFLTMGAIATVDAGMMAHDKMMISQALRAGAQSAIGAKNELVVKSVIETTAEANFTIASGPPVGDQLSVAVSQYCVCPDAMTVVVDCSLICTGIGAPDRFYDLSAQKTFKGVLLTGYTITGQMSVIAE